MVEANVPLISTCRHGQYGTRPSATGSPNGRLGPHPPGLNQVERWFGLLTDKQIRRGVHRSTKELERTILDYIDTTNQNPKPFKWTKSGSDDILAAIQRFCLRTIETAEQQAKIMRSSSLSDLRVF